MYKFSRSREGMHPAPSNEALINKYYLELSCDRTRAYKDCADPYVIKRSVAAHAEGMLTSASPWLSTPTPIANKNIQ